MGFKISGIGFDAIGKTSSLETLGLHDTGSQIRPTKRLFQVPKFQVVGSSCSPTIFNSYRRSVSPSYPQLAASLPVRCMKGSCLARLMATNAEIAFGNWCMMHNGASMICRLLDHRRHRFNPFVSARWKNRKPPFAKKVSGSTISSIYLSRLPLRYANIATIDGSSNGVNRGFSGSMPDDKALCQRGPAVERRTVSLE